MLPIECPPLPLELAEYLTQRQQAASEWNSLQGGRKPTAIKAGLRTAFHEKCGYCEQIEANTVDHFSPQDSDSTARWDWENFILACAVCQGFKLNRLPHDGNGNWMVNPRRDEPLTWLFFDLETGSVAPQATSAQSKARGAITIDRLGFARRSRLQDERRRKFFDVLNCAIRVITAQTPGDEAEAWRQLSDHLQATSPYLGIVRQLVLTENKYSPIITRLRAKRPDFDDLIIEWCLPLQNRQP